MDNNAYLLDFENRIITILREHPDGISEHNLMKLLGIATRFSDSFSMFQEHFLLFHNLHLLREKLLREKKFNIEIESIKITLKNYSPGEIGIELYDPLSNYYKNIENLYETTSDDVDTMLNNFWKKFYSFNKKDEALKTLHLNKNASSQEIKKQYKSLAYKYHPDYGGNKEDFQKLNEAMEILATT